VFLFELLAARPGWPSELAETLFGEQVARIASGAAEMEASAILLAQVAADPHSGLPQDVRQRAIQVCCQWEVTHQQQLKPDELFGYQPQVLAALFTAEDETHEDIWNALLEFDFHALLLNGTQVSDVSPLSGLSNLQGLSLDGTEVSDDAIEALQTACPYLSITK
jgi:hypothetical protein